ncbi:PAAR domain-containing protein [Cryptosporangium aurantiacum]|uniref:Zn-binding Pro-Ala-Ala-Arg (PAAR) domain-containing protein, incolved in TypeVI secretion n=1 Tax=Cryptosporangium aurantiacum TaxID=134849 RepID=A0A1M7RMG5_9ACTN|nr:PAAR domain-containing protein [Cryptosporangium aurantiacum]SHN47381.1 Zn-binding Pro-Ala-Ala-Arg (PAAR) domain-containing protein, incolved in TypeVI secretion [Cryptosporangium aurantiacum]
MAEPAAKQGDRVVGTDIHVVMVPTPAGPVPTPSPHPFAGTLAGALSNDVLINGKQAAVVGSTAVNSPPHIPQGGPFQIPPTNRGTVTAGSATVLVNGKPLARNGDSVRTCNDPVDAVTSSITATGNVLAG